MYDEQIEPGLGRLSRTIHADSILAHLGVEAFVSDVADAVHGETSSTFTQENRFDVHARFRSLIIRRRLSTRKIQSTEVIDQSTRSQHVESAQSAVWSSSDWIVVITMDAEDWDADVEIRVLVVDVGEVVRTTESESCVADDFQLDRTIAETVFA